METAFVTISVSLTCPYMHFPWCTLGVCEERLQPRIFFAEKTNTTVNGSLRESNTQGWHGVIQDFRTEGTEASTQ